MGGSQVASDKENIQKREVQMNAESIAKLQAGAIGNLDALYQEHGFPAVKEVVAHFLADKMDYLDTETVFIHVVEMFSDVALDNQKNAEALAGALDKALEEE